jgi:glycosyltransferase involved in cell wall biosynthesis
MNVSAYVPCFNNEATVAQAVRSIQRQTVPVAELFVVDDGSTDHSVRVVKSLGVRVITHDQNLGRGRVRARAIQEAQRELVLSCDATMALPPDFVERARSWFESEQVAAVFGRVVAPCPSTLADRWRARHLFKSNAEVLVDRHASLATGGALMRKSLVRQAGNFNPLLRAGEDRDLGERLLWLGLEVVFDPGLQIEPLDQNTLAQVLERYRRWNAAGSARGGLRAYLSQIGYSFKVMVREDLREKDFAGALISLLCPHYVFWKGQR